MMQLIIPDLAAIALLGAIECENISAVEFILKIEGETSPNTIVVMQGFAPIHYCAAWENTNFSKKVMDILLKSNGDPNVESVKERWTPLHIACMKGYHNIVLMLMEKGGDVHIQDQTGRTPMEYAVAERHYTLVQRIKQISYEQTVMAKQFIDLNPHVSKLKTVKFNEISPYYKKSLPSNDKTPISPVLFNRSDSNILENTRDFNANRDSFEMNIWRHEVVNVLHTILRKIGLVREANIFDINDTLPPAIETNHKVLILIYFLKGINQYDEINDYFMQSYYDDLNEIIQVAEHYICMNKLGLIFYETKLFPCNVQSRNPLPTTLYDIPRCATKDCSKYIFLKRLIKFNRIKENISHSNITLNFSFELRKTLTYQVCFDEIENYLMLEQEMVESIEKLPTSQRHKDNSFLYLIINPKISNNLSGHSQFLSKSEIWERFLSSIIYVGNGKCNRAYSHVFDAIQMYNAMWEDKENDNCIIGDLRNFRHSNSEILFVNDNLYPYLQNKIPCYPLCKNVGNEELIARFLNIWKSGNTGVVYLHLFHNIMPKEAYTREASIIDCLTLNHLICNRKSFKYYGITNTWTMEKRKKLGIAILYRAMQIYLAKGETILAPRMWL